MVFQLKNQSQPEPNMIEDEIYLIAQYRNLSKQDKRLLQRLLSGDTVAALPATVWEFLSQQLDKAKQITRPVRRQ